MTPPLTFQNKPIPPEISPILERMIRLHPVLTDGDSNLTEREALRFFDFAPDGFLNACDVAYFNEDLPYSDMIPSEDFKKVYLYLSKYSASVRKIKMSTLGGDFRIERPNEKICKTPRFQFADRKRTFLHQGIEILLLGFSTHIDETLLKAAAETAAEMNRFLIDPAKELRVEWCNNLNLPTVNPYLHSFFSGVFSFGPRGASIAITDKLASEMMKDIEERGLNWKLGRSPGDKASSEFLDSFNPLLLKAQKRWDLFELFDPSRYLPGIPKDWGFAYYQKHDILVDDRHLFAAVAVTARYFRKEFNERVKALPEGEIKKLAQQVMNLVAPRFGIKP